MITINYKGKERTISEVSKLTGITYDALYGRYKNGERDEMLLRGAKEVLPRYLLDFYNKMSKRPEKMCEQWRLDPKHFFDWAFNNGWNKNCYIEKPDHFFKYGPNTCKIKTKQLNTPEINKKQQIKFSVKSDNTKEKNNNEKTNVKKSDGTIRLIYNGQSHTIMEWATIIDKPYTELIERYFKYHGNTEKILREISGYKEEQSQIINNQKQNKKMKTTQPNFLEELFQKTTNQETTENVTVINTENIEKKEIKPNSMTEYHGIKIPTYSEEIQSSLSIFKLEVGTEGEGNSQTTLIKIKDIMNGGPAVMDSNGELTDEITFATYGYDEMGTLYTALKRIVEYLGQYTDGAKPYTGEELLSKKEMKELEFNNYINEVCKYRREHGSMRKFSQIGENFGVTQITTEQFFLAELHKAKGKIPMEFTNKLYSVITKKMSLDNIPVYEEKEEQTSQIN